MKCFREVYQIIDILEELQFIQINQSPVPVAVQLPKLCSTSQFLRDTNFFLLFPRKIDYNLF